MSEIRFEWDEKKHSLNKRKHGVSFNEGQTVFADENGLLLDDPDHSQEEDRFILLGLSSRLRLIVVSHTYRKEDAVVMTTGRAGGLLEGPWKGPRST